eukprot:1932685-Amphidinium_carterae.1
MYEYFYDDNEITAVRHLHEGVLYWMTEEDIESLQWPYRNKHSSKETQEQRRSTTSTSTRTR